jgi:hypothetical protein
MSVNMKSEASRTHSRESSFMSIMAGWAEQGVQSVFATQRILLDLAMRQNENVMHVLREQLSDPDYCPAAILSEAAGDGITNFIAGQKLLLDLGKQQHEILMDGLKERVGGWPAAQAMTGLLQRSVETFIHMQEEFLNIAGKQTHNWVEAAKEGKPYEYEHLVTLAREGLENFMKTQKRFLDVITEETAKVKGGKGDEGRKLKKTELAELARQATESFIEAQKNLMDLAGKQMNANVKTVGKTMKLVRPFPFVPLADMTREGVKSYVDAQKALMNTVVKPASEHKATKPAQHRKRSRARAKAVEVIA